jgi:hypothetical protein
MSSWPTVDAERDTDRLELLERLPFAARFEAILSGLTEDADTRGDALERLLNLASRDVPETTGAELGAVLLYKASRAVSPTRERLVQIHSALPERVAPSWQRREAKSLLADTH